MKQLIKVINYVQINKDNLKECWNFVGRGILTKEQEKILLDNNYGIKTPDVQFGFVGDYIVRDNNKYYIYNEKDFQEMVIKQDMKNNMANFSDLEFQQYKICQDILEKELNNVKSDLEIFKQYPFRYDNSFSNKHIKHYVYILKENKVKSYSIKRSIFKNTSCNNKKHLIQDTYYPGMLILNYFQDLKDRKKELECLLKELNMDFAQGLFSFKHYWEKLIDIDLIKFTYKDINNIINNTLEI